MPGLYGGHDGCSGGDDALGCFSTRLMWRGGGVGELYLYAPKDKQPPELCKTKPATVCSSDYGLSIGRGAFKFAAGKWTHVKQTVVLNTPGKQDGAFTLDVNGERVLDLSGVFYRDAPSFGANSLLAEEDVLQAEQNVFAEGAQQYKIDSTLAAPVVARDYTPAFAPAEAFFPVPFDEDMDQHFAPEFAPAWGVFPEPLFNELMPVTNDTVTYTSTTTVVLPTQTTTVFPTSTETAYVAVVAGSSDGPLSAMAYAAPEPVGFTGLFFRCVPRIIIRIEWRELDADDLPIRSTFFGGHEPKFATPRNQFSWFRGFAMKINR
ncbi:hypothetical protein C8Q76DRAFT_731980 [Earliella scabrosa]|nr:hypothetical protein C8Q76DRAFT_731980 [Earliella scabrosa]